MAGPSIDPRAQRRLEEWLADESVDLGNGVVFTVVSQKGRPVGVAGYVKQREGWISVWLMT